jgi:bifunctional DNA primase/polymerase-like protein/AAA domain-containing protein/primase-like protein
MNDQDNTLFTAALSYAQRDWPVLPLHFVQEGRCSCGRVECGSTGKHPRTPQGVKDATTDQETIRRWWMDFPEANIGIATGWKSGLVVLDVDPRHDGDDSLSQLERKYGELSHTVEVLTGGGGRHIYFRHPGGPIKSKAIAPGLDIKADGGYVVGPPSEHISGRTYEWESSSHPEDTPIAQLPPWLLAMLTKVSAEKSAIPALAKIPEGTRNTTLASLAGTMRRKGMTAKAIEAALVQENAQRCNPPLSEHEVKSIAASIAQYHSQSDAQINSRLQLLPDRTNRAIQHPKGFRFTELKALLMEPEEDRPWLVEGLFPMAGFSIVTAKPKVGKSTLARNLALAIARGEKFMNRNTVRGAVVYLALEEKRPEVQRHFQRMGAQEEPVFVHVGAAPEEAVNELALAIVQHKPVLAIIDPLLKLVRVTNANDYAEMSKVLEPLIELARTSGCHLLCVHHSGKGERSGADALLGSTALFAAVDTLLMMQRHDHIRTIATNQRYGEDLPETVVALNTENGRVSLGGTLAQVQVETCAGEVLRVIGNEERIETHIKEAVGGNQTTVAKAIRHLVESGQLQRNGGGRKNDPYRYCLPGVGDKSSGSMNGHISQSAAGLNRENRELTNDQLPMSLDG